MNQALPLESYLRIAAMSDTDLARAIEQLAEMASILGDASRRSDDVYYRSDIRNHINAIEQTLFVARSWRDRPR